MASILRGEVYWADLDPTQGHEQSGRRPVVILSREAFNRLSATVIAVALTSREPRAGFPLTVEIVGTGFPRRSWVKTGQIRTLSVQRLGEKLGEVTADELLMIIEGLYEIIGEEEEAA